MQSLIAAYIITVEKQENKEDKTDKESEIAKLRSKLARLEDLYLDGMIPKDKYKASYLTITEEINTLSMQIDNKPTISPLLREIVNEKNFREFYNNLPRENKQKF